VGVNYAQFSGNDFAWRIKTFQGGNKGFQVAAHTSFHLQGQQ